MEERAAKCAAAAGGVVVDEVRQSRSVLVAAQLSQCSAALARIIDRETPSCRALAARHQQHAAAAAAAAAA